MLNASFGAEIVGYQRVPRSTREYQPENTQPEKTEYQPENTRKSGSIREKSKSTRVKIDT
jgi:hypothetical protein